MNTVVLMGRATDHIELKQTTTGKSVVSFSLAVKKPYTKDGVDFFDVQAWNNTAELLSRHVKKGEQVVIRGRLETRSWTDRNGGKRSETYVVAEDISFVAGKSNTQESALNYQPLQDTNKFEELAADESLPF